MIEAGAGDDVARALHAAERTIALLDRCRPVTAEPERAAMLEDWRRGRVRAPRIRYAALPELSELRAGLELLSQRLARRDSLSGLLSERAAELALDAALVAEIGRPRFAALAVRRFGRADAAADALAARWITLEPAPSEPSWWSDDERAPESLVNQMRAELGRRRIPWRVVISRRLDSAAAVGDGVVVVRAACRHSLRTARRIVAHEIGAHALPRWRAHGEHSTILTCGTAGASEDEEGRALFIERRLGLCDVSRRRELGWRHLAARSVHRGADWVETARMLLELGCPLEHALAITARCHRGGSTSGGLGREAVYLPALLRVQRAFTAEPELEDWFERGRVSVEAARVLRAIEDRSSSRSKIRRVAPQLCISGELECGGTRR